MPDDYEKWVVPADADESEEYRGNRLLAQSLASQGYEAIVNEYVYVGPAEVIDVIQRIPGAWERLQGVGVDLGGGVGCIASAIATKSAVERVYCVEIVEEVVRLCQPIVKTAILGEARNKVVSVVGSFDDIQVDRLDFAVAWDSMHHSLDPAATLRHVADRLRPGGVVVVVDRAHDNSTPDSEIERMLNVVYDRDFLRRNYRDENMILTRRANGEREYRYREWDTFFEQAGLTIEAAVIVRSGDATGNDHEISETTVGYDVGGFAKAKVCYLLHN